LAIVAAILGPSVILAYAEFLPTCGRIGLRYVFSPWAEHGIAGIAQIVLAPLGCPGEWCYRIGTGLQLLVAGWATVMVCRVAATARSERMANQFQTGSDRGSAPLPTVREQTSGVLFTALLTPHLLMYDLTLLAASLVDLWSTPRWRLGIALYLATSAITIPLYETIGFSLVPIVIAAVLYRLTCATASPAAPSSLGAC
jgi:hypothetical protein